MSEIKSSDDSNSNPEDNNSRTAVVNNRFANDGSFLEMFKQMQKNLQTNSVQTDSCSEQNTDTDLLKTSDKTDELSENSKNKLSDELSASEAQEAVDNRNQSNSSSAKKSFVNISKRKPKTLKTGIIKKQKNDGSDEEESGAGPTDAWNRYMKEVRKYKEKYGDDNDKNRPLVK